MDESCSIMDENFQAFHDIRHWLCIEAEKCSKETRQTFFLNDEQNCQFSSQPRFTFKRPRYVFRDDKIKMQQSRANIDDRTNGLWKRRTRARSISGSSSRYWTMKYRGWWWSRRKGFFSVISRYYGLQLVARCPTPTFQDNA